MNPADARRWHASLVLMAASGFAGLGYQIVWTQQCALWLGAESAAVLAVIAAFFGGLALGALALGPRIERSARPVRWYAACEAAIGLWSLVLASAMAPFSDMVLALTGPQPTPAWQWTVAFGATFFMLLPATAAMGATLPAIERVTASLRAGGRSIATHYASNTLGAVLGVLAIAFWLVPAFGLARTAALCVVLNLACAAAAIAWLPARSEPAARLLRPVARDSRAALLRLALTGLLGIGYEVLVVRVLSQVSEDTVYTFALLLAVYLVGSALGAAAYARWLARMRDAHRLVDRLLAALAAACLAGAASLWAAESLKAAWRAAFGLGFHAAIGAEAALAIAAFALPTIVMGALFSHLGARASAAGLGFGPALGANTLGAAAAPLLFGVLLGPALGAKLSLLVVAAGYLLMIDRRAWAAPFAWLPAGVVAALVLWAPPLAFVDVPEGGYIVSYEEGAMAAVSVVEDGDGVARLRINNRQQEGSSASRLADARQALLPLLLHPAPRHALFLGLGTGITAAAAAEDPGLTVDAVELLPEVIAASHEFAGAAGAGAARLHLVAADARRYVRTTAQRYDVIVADNFHPARSGSGALYTIEHFRAVRGRLDEGGLFCQWLPLHQLDLTTLRSIVRSFLAVYPHGAALLASNSLATPVLGLIGRGDDGPFDIAGARDRLVAASRSRQLDGLAIDDDLALFGSFVAGPDALIRFAGDAPANTDDAPVVAYRAPRIAYAPDSLPQDRLIALLHELSIDPRELIGDSGDAAWTARLVAYWSARDRFIEAGRGMRPSDDAAAMLARVREPLLAVLRISPDFRPAREPLLRIADALAHDDAGTARELLAAVASTEHAARIWPENIPHSDP